MLVANEGDGRASNLATGRRKGKRKEEEKRWDFFLPSYAYSRWRDFLKAFSPKHTFPHFS